LSAEDRAIIRRVYPEPGPVFADNFSLSPNPFQDAPTLSYLSAAEEQFSLQWLSVDGKLLGEEHFNAQRGINEWQLVHTPEKAGWYLLRVGNDRQNGVLKVVRME
jgi:hypothetical protein